MLIDMLNISSAKIICLVWFFCCLEKCNSLREVPRVILGLSGNQETVRINHLPRKSRLSDANKCRKVEFFEEIDNKLPQKYSYVLSDSRSKIASGKNIKLLTALPLACLKTY
jgi:hypothetical protein